jgi:crotonobetainyl-CoA:carnitine CoA-transferase CaiB-like acyl-CoA transferase
MRAAPGSPGCDDRMKVTALMDDRTTAGPLAGIRVIDLTSVIMGPLATQMLGDFGADVITIEPTSASLVRAMSAGPHPELSGIALNLLRNYPTSLPVVL